MIILKVSSSLLSSLRLTFCHLLDRVLLFVAFLSNAKQQDVPLIAIV